MIYRQIVSFSGPPPDMYFRLPTACIRRRYDAHLRRHFPLTFFTALGASSSEKSALSPSLGANILWITFSPLYIKDRKNHSSHFLRLELRRLRWKQPALCLPFSLPPPFPSSSPFSSPPCLSFSFFFLLINQFPLSLVGEKGEGESFKNKDPK